MLLTTVMAVLALAACPVNALRVGAAQVKTYTNSTPSATILFNAHHFVQLASASHAELISFPEFSLMGDYTFDCDAPSDLEAYSEVVGPAQTKIECLTSLFTPLQVIGCLVPHKHISYNTVEKDGSNYYNTQVVTFNYTIVARYRKYNVFYKNCFDSPSLELVTFNVSSSYRFGIFTCYDILFSTPKEDLVKMGVKYFSYSSAIPVVGHDAVAIFSVLNNVTVVSANFDAGEGGVVVDGKFVASCPSSLSSCIATYDL